MAAPIFRLRPDDKKFIAEIKAEAARAASADAAAAAAAGVERPGEAFWTLYKNEEFARELDSIGPRVTPEFAARLVAMAERERTLIAYLLATDLVPFVEETDDAETVIGLARTDVLARRLSLVPAAMTVAVRSAIAGQTNLLRVLGKHRESHAIARAYRETDRLRLDLFENRALLAQWLGQRSTDRIVELATGDNARVIAQMPTIVEAANSRPKIQRALFGPEIADMLRREGKFDELIAYGADDAKGYLTREDLIAVDEPANFALLPYIRAARALDATDIPGYAVALARYYEDPNGAVLEGATPADVDAVLRRFVERGYNPVFISAAAAVSSNPVWWEKIVRNWGEDAPLQWTRNNFTWSDASITPREMSAVLNRVMPTRLRLGAFNATRDAKYRQVWRFHMARRIRNGEIDVDDIHFDTPWFEDWLAFRELVERTGTKGDWLSRARGNTGAMLALRAFVLGPRF